MSHYIKPTGGNIRQLVTGIITHTHDQTLRITTSEINNYASNALSYNMVNGAHLSTARGLRRRRVVRRRVVRRRVVLRGLFRPRVTHRRIVHRRVVHVRPVVQPIVFRPFEGLKDLKFGRDYKRVLIEQSIRSPGQSWGKITAMEGTRQGKNIEYTAAFGWATGNGIQQFTHTKVRKCKKILFWKKCKNHTVKIPRGFTPHELQQVERALHNPILEQLRSKLSSGRLLSTIAKTHAWNMPVGMNQVQILTSVNRMKTGAAVQSLIGSSIPFSMNLGSKARSLTVVDEFGNRHLVEQSFKGSKVNLKVYSSI